MRRPSAAVLMRKAVFKKNINDFLWACLDLASAELKADGKFSTFEGPDLKSIASEIIKLGKVKSENSEKDLSILSDWLDNEPTS